MDNHELSLLVLTVSFIHFGENMAFVKNSGGKLAHLDSADAFDF